jgi:protein-S-isoprenylcysteine O-methyltransferase Ste14
MTERVSRWGVGPRFVLPSMAYAGAAWYATRSWPEVCLLRWPPPTVLMTFGALLIALGATLWLTGLITVMRAYSRDQLRTSGVFAMVRHPVYSAWIVFMFPGGALFFQSWPMLAASPVAYTIFKLLIHREDECLQRRYGQAYLDYRARVNEVCPFPWLWKRSSR